MTQSFDDIDSLIRRLKSAAQQLETRQLDTQRLDTEPPPAYRDAIGDLLKDGTTPRDALDPQHPRLAELVAAHRSNDEFLERAYRLLMGREIDPQGRRSYLDALPRTGRFYVLAELLRADEARRYIDQQGITIPRRRALTLPLGVVGRLGPLARVARLPLRWVYYLLSVAMRPRLRISGRVAELEVQANYREGLVDQLLLEMNAELEQQRGLFEQECQAGKEQDNKLQEYQQQLSLIERHQPALWSALQQQRRAVERLVAGETALPADTQAASQSLSQDLMDAYYLAFEDACRGSESDIFTHLRRYRPQWMAALEIGDRAFDIGCGRGEWLRLLATQGFVPQGADLNVAMVDHCQAKGLDVVLEDAIVAMKRQPDDHFALVSGFHIAEHLPFEVLYTLVAEAQRILAPGGVLILETPNPENILVGSHTFYHDPTHLNPLTPTAMTFLLTYHGFAEINVRRFNPYPEEAKVPGNDPLTERVNGHLCGPQDFAVVGKKVEAKKVASINKAANKKATGKKAAAGKKATGKKAADKKVASGKKTAAKKTANSKAADKETVSKHQPDKIDKVERKTGEAQA